MTVALPVRHSFGVLWGPGIAYTPRNPKLGCKRASEVHVTIFPVRVQGSLEVRVIKQYNRKQLVCSLLEFPL